MVGNYVVNGEKVPSVLTLDVVRHLHTIPDAYALSYEIGFPRPSRQIFCSVCLKLRVLNVRIISLYFGGIKKFLNYPDFR
ncbi:hypothetical protein GQ457_12G015130 [Hibiscus cannabinus]